MSRRAPSLACTPLSASRHRAIAEAIAATTTATAGAAAAITGATLAANATTDDRAGWISNGEGLADIATRVPDVLIRPAVATLATGEARATTTTTTNVAAVSAAATNATSSISACATAGGRSACATNARICARGHCDRPKYCTCCNCQDHDSERSGVQQ
jgi:hypothetical protein